MAINFNKSVPVDQTQVDQAMNKAINQAVAETPAKHVGSFLAQKLQEKQTEGLPAVEAQTEVMVTDELTTQVEELADLDAKMKEFGGYEIVKRIEAIKKVLQGVAKEKDKTLPVVFKTPTGSTVVFSACGLSTVFSDKQKLVMLLTPQVYMDISSVTMGDAKKYLGELELASVTTKVPGTRTLVSVTKKDAA
jgi:CheY-like chemotaxis protein